MASFRTATLLLGCMVLVLESTKGQLQKFAPEKLHEATQVEKILLDRCSKVCLLLVAATRWRDP